MVPYERAEGGFVAQGGTPTCFPFEFVSRSLISKIVVVQVNGDPATFNVNIFNKSGTCEGGSLSDSAGDQTGGLPSRLFRVCPTLQSNGAGILEYFSEEANGGFGFPFFSHDKRVDNPRARLGIAATLYIEIDPAGSGAKEFAICIGGHICEP